MDKISWTGSIDLLMAGQYLLKLRYNGQSSFSQMTVITLLIEKKLRRFLSPFFFVPLQQISASSLFS